MINEPLFQSDFISALLRNFSYYLSYRNWTLHLAVVFALLWLTCKWLGKKNTGLAVPFAQLPSLGFNKKSPWDIGTAVVLGACFVFYALAVFYIDASLFANIDTMGIGTTSVFKQGIHPFYGYAHRLAPFGFFDLNLIYALTHNYNLINIYILLQTAAVIWLLYIIFDYIPVPARLLGIAAALCAPAFFLTNNIVFPERMILIFICLSLLFLKKFLIGQNYRHLWYYALFMTVAIFSKETVLFFYFGIFVLLAVYNIYAEKIIPASFLHPFQSARQFPVETITFLSLLSFCMIYLFLMPPLEENGALLIRRAALPDVIRLYRIELGIIAAAALLFIYRLIARRQKFDIGVFALFGSLSSGIFIVFVYRFIPFIGFLANKTYYMQLSVFFALIYIFSGLKKKYTAAALFTLFFGMSSFYNWQALQTEQGRSYRQVAEYIVGDIAPDKTAGIYISENTEFDPTEILPWSSAYKYYFPNYRLTFKTYCNDPITNAKLRQTYFVDQQSVRIYFPVKFQDFPEPGDYYVVKKNEGSKDSINLLKEIPHQMLYENKFFYVFKILTDKKDAVN